MSVGEKSLCACACMPVCVCSCIPVCMVTERKRERVGGSEGGVWAVTNSSEWVRMNPSCLFEKQ